MHTNDCSHPLMFLIGSTFKYSILLVGETEEGILLGYSIKVPSIMLLCQDRIINFLMFLCLACLLNHDVVL